MIVDAKSGKKRAELVGHAESIYSIAISPDYKLIATGGFDEIVKIWDYQTGRLLKTLDDPFTYESFWAIPPEGDFAIVATTKSARVFNLKTGRPGKELPVKMPKFIRSIHMPDSKTFVVFDKVKANVYNYPECTLRCTGPEHGGAGIQSNELELSPNKRFAATIDVYPVNNAHVWDFNTGQIIKTFSGKNNIDGAAITNDLFAIAIDDHVDVYSFDGASYNKKYTFKVPSLPGEEAYATYGIEISPNNKYLVVEAGSGVNATMWSLESGKQIREFDEKAIAVSHFNNDNTIVALGHIDGPFSLYNIQSGEKMADFPGHTKHVKEFYFVDENKKLLTTSFDGLTKFWDIEKNELIATFISVGGDDFLTFVPEGPYMASPKALKALAIRVDNRAYPFDQYDLLLNKPHKVLEEIGSASESVLEIYKKAYQKRLKRMGFTEDMLKLDYHLPEIAYTGELPLSTKNKEITFGVSASDSKYNLDRINVWVNDVPVFTSKGISIKSKSVKKYQQDITVELTEGNNKIQVSAHNQNGIESIRELFNVNCEVKAPKPDLYLVTIGVSEFKNATYNLTYAAKDATDIQTTFKDNPTYNNVHAFNYANSNATTDNILKVKEELAKSKTDDKVIIFVASHGLLDNNMDYYIATHDVDFNNPAARGLPYDILEGLLDGIPARQKLMIIDACHSGEVDKEDMVLADANILGGSVKARGFKTVKAKENQVGAENSFELMRELFADLRRGTGAVVISSAGGAEFAFESSEWKNGVFTYALLEGLKSGNADANKNGEIVVSELRDYVFDRVKKLTNGQQNPTSRRENLEFDFKVASVSISGLNNTREKPTYKTIKIGDQVWMAENLNIETTNGSWCYENNANNCDEYGRLYNWESAQKVCPEGWHLPSDEEWKTLEKHLGMRKKETDKKYWRSKSVGDKLKVSSSWYNKDNGNNESGFSARPGGVRNMDESYDHLGILGCFWTSTPSDSYDAWTRRLVSGKGGVDRAAFSRTNGFSVRCVKD